MKSLKNLILIIATVPCIAHAGDSLMYKHFLKLAEKYGLEVYKRNDYDKKRLDKIEEGKSKEEMKEALFDWIQKEKVGGVTDRDRDYKDFGQTKTPIVKKDPSEFSRLLAKLNDNAQTILGIATVEKSLLGHGTLDYSPERCSDRSKDESIRKRLKAHAITHISHENHGKMLRPSDADEKRELNRFANRLFRDVCGRKPMKSKQVAKRPVETPKVTTLEATIEPVQQSAPITIEFSPQALDLSVVEEVREEPIATCNLEAVARVFDGREETELKSTLALLYREAQLHAMNDKPEINLRLYIFYYLVNNQNNPAAGDPYDDNSLLAKIAKCARQEAIEVKKKEREVQRQEAIQQYEALSTK